MTIQIFEWVALILTVLVASSASKVFLDSRNTANSLTALASKDFFSHSNKLMKTPEDIPSSILDTIDVMLRTMNNGHGARELLKHLKSINSKSVSIDRADNDLLSQVEKMRPELKELYSHTIVSWLNYVSNRSFLYQILISSEMKKMIARSGKIEPDSSKASLAILSDFDCVAC